MGPCKLLRAEKTEEVMRWFIDQGASIAAAACAYQQKRTSYTTDGADVEGWQPLRFAILCSGYVSPAPEHQQLHADAGSISMPSLHVYGTKAKDGGITAVESRLLADMFDSSLRQTVKYNGGHYIPVTKAVLAQLRAFLRHFRGAEMILQ